MKNIKDLNIWKAEEKQNCSNDVFLNTEITDLNLTVRSFNCLKRANCNTVGDVLNCIGEEGQGLRRIRNLGSKSETEIIEKVNEYRNLCETNTPPIEKKKVTIIKPAKKIWDRGIEEFNLSQFALTKLKACGVNKVKDLYTTNPSNEPGWYAVRELFEKIPSCR